VKVKYAIIGGGVAGLSCAIALCEKKERPLIIEAGHYPSHKICGEFISYEGLAYLKNWAIHPLEVPQAVIYSGTRRLSFTFPKACGALSHMQLDPLLAKRAEEGGAMLLTDTQVIDFRPKMGASDDHLIRLSNGQEIKVEHVLIATGRLGNAPIKTIQPSYVGYKAHFKNVDTKGNLELYSLPGAYLGITPIEGGMHNVACIAKNHQLNPEDFMRHLMTTNTELQRRFGDAILVFKQWMTGSIASFGMKETPEWIDAYFIGDAAQTIPPATGGGLSLAIIGGCFVAEYACKGKYLEFKRDWARALKSQMRFAKLFNEAMLRPKYSSALIQVIDFFPSLAKTIFDSTRNFEK
jgi:flavin-dependent dehydrogenase